MATVIVGMTTSLDGFVIDELHIDVMPLLLAAGFHQTDVPVPWLGRKHLRLELG